MNTILLQSLVPKTSRWRPRKAEESSYKNIISDDRDPDEEIRSKMLENLKKEVKQIMEEAVTRKFIHADSSSITSLCAAIEAGVSHGLKKRVGGLLPAYDTQTLLTKLAKVSESAAELVRKLSGESGGKEGKMTAGPESPRLKLNFTTYPNNYKKINGHNVTGHCGKYLWIRIALLEKLLIKIVEDLKENASQFYEPDALLSDPGDGRIFIELLDGPCALDFSKMKTPDSYWADPSADELVQRHKIHSGLYQESPAAPSSQRPKLGTMKSIQDDNKAVAPVLAREHIESLHQNNYTILLYGKNNVYLQPHEDANPIPGYLSLHKGNESLLLKWTPNKLMSGSNEKEKSEFWDYALTVNLHDVVYLHCHQQDGYGLVILIGQDGVQRPPIRFPTSGSLLSFLNCLENGLYPHGQLDPPLFAPRSKGLTLPSLTKGGSGDNSKANSQDYVFRLVSGTKPEDIVSNEMDKLASKRSSKKAWWGRHEAAPAKTSFKRMQKQPSVPTMECLHSACETMRRQITLRAFSGWCSYVRHLRTVRTHLSWLVYNDTLSEDENGVHYQQGLTVDLWKKLTSDNGQVKEEAKVKKYVYWGGVEHGIREEVWPYLLGHYKFGSTSEDRQNTDRLTADKYRDITTEWKAVEAVILQREKENEMDGISTDSTGSRDEVFEQLQMIGSGLEKNQTRVTKRGSIEEPDIEGLDPEARARLLNGHGVVERDEFCECEENTGDLSSLCEKCTTPHPDGDEGANGVHLPNGHDTSFVVETGELVGGRDAENPELLTQCSRESSGSNTCECPYSAELLDNFSLNLHRIDKDVQRCDRNYKYFTDENLEKLRNVVSSYVWKTLDIGYVQGMCDLVAPLLVVFDDEPKTYSCFVHLMERMNHNFPHGVAMDRNFANMRSLIQILDPEMFEHLQQNGDLTHFYFCYRWFLLDFKRELLYDDVFVTWETIWAARHCASEHFVLFIALALLQFYRDIILDNKMDFTDIIKFFNEMAERHDAQAALKVSRNLVRRVQELIKNQ